MTRMPPAIVVRPLRELLAGFAANVPDMAVRDLTLDSRQVSEGALFLACRGTREHGLKHLPQARERGAAAVLWEPAPGIEAPGDGIPAVAVEKLSERAGEIAARFFGQPSARLHGIGITGTDGKTSTAYLIAQALERLDQPAFYIGTLGWGRYGSLHKGDLTTPDPVNLQRELRDAVEDGCEAVAMEVSSIGLHQSRIAGMQFHSAVLTNVGRDHLDYHGTLENYVAAKRRLFERGELQARVMNRDDTTGRKWAAEFSGITLYGLDGEAPQSVRYLLGRNLQLAASGLAFEVDSHAGRASIKSGLLGRFNAYNLLAALAALLEKDAALDEACAALSACGTVPGRIEGFSGTLARPLVVVDYAHTPQALAQVLQAVRAHTAGKLWCVFGCGGDRDRGKRPLMAAAVARHADRVIVTDDNPRSEDPAGIVREIWAGFPPGHEPPVIHDRARAIETAVREAAAGDVVVVAGKGHEDYQIYGSERRAFSDRAFVRALVGGAA
jgi:UDP-N-acetylmuramoyl-L-alanyl-D-glutamate--2,6-diaminopimelate ligase